MVVAILVLKWGGRASQGVVAHVNTVGKSVKYQSIVGSQLEL
jgi:hypothetical protein